MSTKPPSGMRDFLPAECARRRFAIDVVRRVYERHHFEPVETPTLERIQTLTGKYGDEGDQLIFKVMKRAQKLVSALAPDEVDPSSLADMGLRYDLTVPLARLVAQYQNDLPRIFKRYQIAPVWRADRPARGRFREFYQCDVDVVGSTSLLVEVDVVSAAAEAMAELGFDDFTIRINDRRLLAAMTDRAGIAPGRSGRALVALDKLDKIGRDGVLRELTQHDFEPESAATLLSLIGSASLQDLNTSLGDFAPQEAVERLASLMEVLGELGLPGRLTFDPSLARGLTYYTGPIFEITLPGFSGSVGGGGRYDDLIGMFLGRCVPAAGISLGLERLIMIMNERDMFPAELGGCDVFVAQFADVPPLASLALASRLRAEGLRVDVSPEASKLKKQFKQAQQMGARVVALVGPDEASANTVVLKTMSTGAQQTVGQAEACTTVRSILNPA